MTAIPKSHSMTTMAGMEDSDSLFEDSLNDELSHARASISSKEDKQDDHSINPKSPLNSIINRLKNPEQPNAFSSKISNILSKSSVAHSINNSIEKHRVSKVWHGVVNVAVIEASNLTCPPKNNNPPDPFVRLKLGMDKFKTKTKSKTCNPRWVEEFDLYMYDDSEYSLEVSVRNAEIGSKESILGECTLNLNDYEDETSHCLNLPLDDKGASIFLLLTISYIGEHLEGELHLNKPKADFGVERDEFAYFKTMTNMDKVGCLQINVLKAVGLTAADLRGTSDPYCVVQLDNNRVQTHTIYKTVNPEWNKTFTMNIKDIHSSLSITLLDENKNRKVEFLGKIAIPLLKVRSGERVWYQLKDKKLLGKVKGALLLQIDYAYNPLRAAVRTFHPKEPLHMMQEPKLRISAMKRNVERARRLVMAVAGVAKMLQSCLSWESKPKSLFAYVIYCASVLLLEWYMVPLIFIVIIVKNFILISLTYSFRDYSNTIVATGETEDTEEDLESKEDKKSILEKFQGLQEVGLMVQEVLDQVVSMCEKIRNMFLWRSPWLTWLGLMLLILATVVLFLVPPRILLLIWGTRKFSKKLLDPNYEDNNEVFNYLDRLQSDKELLQHKELQVDPIIMTIVKKDEKKPKSS